MTTLTQGNQTGEFLLSQANGTRSREEVTISSAAGAMIAGTVLAKLDADGKYVEYDDVGTDGTQTAAGILYADVANSASDQKAVIIARDAEVDSALLTGYNANAKADLAALGIIVR